MFICLPLGVGLMYAGRYFFAPAMQRFFPIFGRQSGLEGTLANVTARQFAGNCAQCAIATDATLAGRPACAIYARQMKPLGTPISVLEAEFRAAFRSLGAGTAREAEATATAVLQGAGDGAQAVIWASNTQTGVGHVFNGVNQGGSIIWVDGSRAGAPANWTGYTHWEIMITRPR